MWSARCVSNRMRCWTYSRGVPDSDCFRYLDVHGPDRGFTTGLLRGALINALFSHSLRLTNQVRTRGEFATGCARRRVALDVSTRRVFDECDPLGHARLELCGVTPRTHGLCGRLCDGEA